MIGFGEDVGAGLCYVYSVKKMIRMSAAYSLRLIISRELSYSNIWGEGEIRD